MEEQNNHRYTIKEHTTETFYNKPAKGITKEKKTSYTIETNKTIQEAEIIIKSKLESLIENQGFKKTGNYKATKENTEIHYTIN